MNADELALRFRRWADSELAFIERIIATDPVNADALRQERQGLRRAVAWVECAADVPDDQRLVNGGRRYTVTTFPYGGFGRALDAATEADRELPATAL